MGACKPAKQGYMAVLSVLKSQAKRSGISFTAKPDSKKVKLASKMLEYVLKQKNVQEV